MEFEPPADNYPNATRPQFNPLGVFGPTDYLQGCRGSSTVAVTQNSGDPPAMFKNGNGAGRRISFVAQTSGLHLIQVTNVMVALVDTLSEQLTRLSSTSGGTRCLEMMCNGS